MPNAHRTVQGQMISTDNSCVSTCPVRQYIRHKWYDSVVASRRVDFPIQTFSTTWCRICTKISLRTPVPGPGLCLVWSAEHVENAVPVHRSDPPGEDDIRHWIRRNWSNIYTITYLQCCRSCLSISTRLLFSSAPLFTSTNISLVISSHYVSAKGHFHQFYSHKFSPRPFSLIFSLLVRFRNPPASDIHGSWEPV